LICRRTPSNTGKKTDLQNRAIELVRLNSPDINSKIRELSNQMYKSLGTAPSVNPYSSSFSDSSTTTSPSRTSTYTNPYHDPIPNEPPISIKHKVRIINIKKVNRKIKWQK
jgi:hypothetical protein